jgi:hypothetical protein
MNSQLVPDRSPWFTWRYLPCIPSPTTPRALSSLLCCPPSVTVFRTLVSDRLLPCPVGVSQTSGRPRAFTRVPVWTSPLMRRLVAAHGRIVFALLRTASSPPVALHPTSRRRSYLQLSRVGTSRERTCTSLIAPAPRRTHTGEGRYPGRFSRFRLKACRNDDGARRRTFIVRCVPRLWRFAGITMCR